MSIRRLLAVAVLILLDHSISVVAAADEPISLGARRELFVDDFLIQDLSGCQLALSRPRDEGVALAFDAPWEGAFCAYCTVIRTPDKFQLSYRGLHNAGADGSDDEVTCYAESVDGVKWTKPKLGIFEVSGTRENNVILANAAPVTHNFSPFLDTRPDVSEAERYKALGGTKTSGLIAYVSADGIHWRQWREEPVFRDSDWVFDSQNVAFYSPAEECYVLYYRKSAEGLRAIGRATSPDFVNWSEPARMIYSDTESVVPSNHLYTNQTHPYFRAPHLYISLAARFMPGRRVLEERQAAQLGVHLKYFGDTSDAILMTSRGGNRFDRTFPDGFLRPGIGPENWVSRTNYPALNVVQTGPHEMSFYANQDYGQPTAHLRRYSLRLDGFSSVRAPFAGGEMTTRPFTFDGRKLLINFATSAAGGLRVELQDRDGRPLPGFTLDHAVEQIGNEIERPVSWKSGDDVGALAGTPIRLRFVMNDADLYAIRFE